MSFTSRYYLSHNIVDINLLKGTTFCHVNCRSILNKLDEIKKLYPHVNILSVSESWLKQHTCDSLVYWPGKRLFRQDRINGRGGGVACYVDLKLATYTTIIEELSHISENLESLCLKICQPNNRKLTILTVYRPPTGSVQHFFEELQNIINSELLGSSEKLSKNLIRPWISDNLYFTLLVIINRK